MENKEMEVTQVSVVSQAAAMLDRAIGLMRALLAHLQAEHSNRWYQKAIGRGEAPPPDLADLINILADIEWQLNDHIVTICRPISEAIQDIANKGQFQITPELANILSAIVGLHLSSELGTPEEQFQFIPPSQGGAAAYSMIDPQPVMGDSDTEVHFPPGKGFHDKEGTFHQAPTRGCCLAIRGGNPIWYWDLGERTEEDRQEDALMEARGQILPTPEEDLENG